MSSEKQESSGNSINGDTADQIRKITLKNAYEHEGQAKKDAVIAKIAGSNPELKKKIKEIIPIIEKTVKEVNSIPLQKQKEEIEEKFPDIFEEEEHAVNESYDSSGQRYQFSLPPLDGAQKGEVVTRFPPEPNGYPHIGHAKAATINEEYARMYDGKLILRFDDTNPDAERMEYYAAIKVGLEWLGINFDHTKNTSDDMETFYKKGRSLIESQDAYVCICDKERISKNRREMKRCGCSLDENEANLEKWEKMFSKYKTGEAIVRFRGDMTSENTVMRDPTLFRIIDEAHPIHKDNYRVWPSYDFAVAVEDSMDGVTHAFRSKEYELRRELYYSLLEKMGLRKPIMMEFGRLEFEGMPVSKRVLRPLLDEGKITGYDDPRLPTLEGLKRRGIHPEAIRRFIVSLGFTKADTLSPFDSLEAFNRTIIDKTCIRLNLVLDPVKLVVNNNPIEKAELQNHPNRSELGKREIPIDGNFYIASSDADGLSPEHNIRLMGLYNVKIKAKSPFLQADYIGDDHNVDFKKVQWVSTKDSTDISIVIPAKPFDSDNNFREDSLVTKEGVVEKHYLELNEGTQIQFIRFGYCRKDSAKQVIFTHK